MVKLAFKKLINHSVCNMQCKNSFSRSTVDGIGGVQNSYGHWMLPPFVKASYSVTVAMICICTINDTKGMPYMLSFLVKPAMFTMIKQDFHSTKSIQESIMNMHVSFPPNTLELLSNKTTNIHVTTINMCKEQHCRSLAGPFK